jgi:hypothetical protein
MEDQDILNQLDSVDLSTVETSYPLLKTGVYPTTVASCQLEDQKAPKTGKNLVIKYTLTETAESVDGRQVNPGFAIMERISLTKTFKDDGSPKYDPLPRLAQFREAIFGKAETGTGFMPLEQYIGQAITIRVKHDPHSKGRDGTDYGPQSSVNGYVRKA